MPIGIVIATVGRVSCGKSRILRQQHGDLTYAELPTRCVPDREAAGVGGGMEHRIFDKVPVLFGADVDECSLSQRWLGAQYVGMNDDGVGARFDDDVLTTDDQSAYDVAWL